MKLKCATCEWHTFLLLYSTYGYGTIIYYVS